MTVHKKKENQTKPVFFFEFLAFTIDWHLVGVLCFYLFDFLFWNRPRFSAAIFRCVSYLVNFGSFERNSLFCSRRKITKTVNFSVQGLRLKHRRSTHIDSGNQCLYRWGSVLGNRHILLCYFNKTVWLINSSGNAPKDSEGSKWQWRGTSLTNWLLYTFKGLWRRLIILGCCLWASGSNTNFLVRLVFVVVTRKDCLAIDSVVRLLTVAAASTRSFPQLSGDPYTKVGMSLPLAENWQG